MLTNILAVAILTVASSETCILAPPELLITVCAVAETKFAAVSEIVNLTVDLAKLTSDSRSICAASAKVTVLVPVVGATSRTLF